MATLPYDNAGNNLIQAITLGISATATLLIQPVDRVALAGFEFSFLTVGALQL